MKKSMLFFVMGMFLISFASAAEWDNRGEYDSETRTMKITNMFGLGKDIAELRLNTPLENIVPQGYQKVAEFTIENSDDYNDALRIMKFYDIRDNSKEIERTFDYKVLKFVDVTVNDYKEVCNNLGNGSVQGCTDIITGSHVEQKELWVDLDSKDLLKGTVTVGVFTEVLKGDRIEWIPEFYGVMIDEWAIWTQSLNVNLVSYWKLNETSEPLVDSLGLNNLSADFSPLFAQPGLINFSVGFDSNGDSFNQSSCSTLGFGLTQDFTFNIWANISSFGNDRELIGTAATDPWWRVFVENTTGIITFEISSGAGNSTFLRTIGGIPIDGQFHQVAGLRNNSGTELHLFIDGALNNSNSSFQPDNAPCSNFRIGDHRSDRFLDGDLDEFGVWNRSLSGAEITQLYNAGAGITFKEFPTATLNSPANNTILTDRLVQFNCFGNSTSGASLVNMSLYTNESGTWESKNVTTGLSDSNFTLQVNRTLPEDNFIWSCEVCDSEDDCAFATQNNTFSIDASPPNLTVESPAGLLDFNIVGGNETLNWTVNDTNLDSCWYDYSGTNITVGCFSNPINFTLELDNTNLTFYANDTQGLESSNFTSWSYKVLEINQTFSNQTIEGNLEDFLATIVLGSGQSIASVILNYNNTINIGVIGTSGANTTLSKLNFIVPEVSVDTNITFNWSIVLSTLEVINLTSQNQTILNLGIDNCSTFTNQILNFTMVDEEEQTTLSNTTLEIALDLFSADRSQLVISLNGSFEDQNPIGLCLNQNLTGGIQYSSDGIIRYVADGYANEYFNIFNLTLNNETGIINITLFDLNISDSTEFQLTFTGLDFLPVENALVFVERQYIAENTFKTVELPKTDSNGQTVLHLVRNEVIYNIRVNKDGETLGLFSNIIAFCQDFTIGECTINLNALSNETPIFNYDEGVGIIYEGAPTFNSTTNDVTFSFASSDSTTRLVSMNVERRDVFGNISICNNTILSTSGTLSCDIGQNLSDTSLFTTVSIDGTTWLSSSVVIDSSAYGSVGYALWFIFTLVMVLMLRENKNGIMIGLLISYIGAVSFGLTVGGITGIGTSGIWIISITVVGIWQINRSRVS